MLPATLAAQQADAMCEARLRRALAPRQMYAVTKAAHAPVSRPAWLMPFPIRQDAPRRTMARRRAARVIPSGAVARAQYLSAGKGG